MSKRPALCVTSPPGPPARVAQDGLVPYSAAVDLAEEYGVSQVLETAGRLIAKTTLMRGTLEKNVRTTPPQVTKTKLCQKTHGPIDTASHEIIENFMTKMTELLKTTLANQRGERTKNTSNDKALE
ncbi:hypothetical protein M9H77_26587 [Catharanthus roseus]|uniref:Uncharacterized protein n=1 Tax=Catharanthus roseus TaxID=4058 RepID=A0ACC0AC98_CATRO|nr:hypothetical protein M9H77_26587 [Catharanthus roseus]